MENPFLKPVEDHELFSVQFKKDMLAIKATKLFHGVKNGLDSLSDAHTLAAGEGYFTAKYDCTILRYLAPNSDTQWLLDFGCKVVSDGVATALAEHEVLDSSSELNTVPDFISEDPLTAEIIVRVAPAQAE